MPARTEALVSADHYVAVVRVHSDRVHDLLRRIGCLQEEATELVEASAGDLARALVRSPDAVVDMAGWWFGAAVLLARRVLAEAGVELWVDAVSDEGDASGRSVLAGAPVDQRIREALDALREPERLAVLLRDAYDLGPEAVAVAVHLVTESRTPLSTGAADRLVARGRLHLLAAYDHADAPTLRGHTGRLEVDEATLARLADGSLPLPQASPLRRHTQQCPACEDMVETQARARRLLAALPVIALADDDRDAMLARIMSLAERTLPSRELLSLRAAQAATETHHWGLWIALALVLAIVIGVAIGYATRNAGGASSSPAHLTPTTSLTYGLSTYPGPLIQR